MGWKNSYTGETSSCLLFRTPLTKNYNFSETYCENCRYGLDDEDDSESLNVYDDALIWASHGKDEDYTFGYSEEELEDAL